MPAADRRGAVRHLRRSKPAASASQARYEIEGLLPGGSPVLDLTLPETLARFGSGPDAATGWPRSPIPAGSS